MSLERYIPGKRWEKISKLFLAVYEKNELTSEEVKRIEKEVVFGEIDRLSVWDYLQEAVSWGELEFDEKKSVYRMTDKGRKRWEPLSDQAKDGDSEQEGVPDEG